MGWHVSWQVRCEVCKCFGPRDHNSTKAEAKAIKAGWILWDDRGIHRHLCGECKQETPEWWQGDNDG